MSACSSSACDAIEAKFDTRLARRELLRYRKHGPGPTTRLRRDGVTAGGGPGETLVDIGAGIGPLTFELLERGVRRAVSVEASAPASPRDARKPPAETAPSRSSGFTETTWRWPRASRRPTR